MTDTVIDPAFSPVLGVEPDPPPAHEALPSTQLFRIAELAATALNEADPSGAAGPQIPEQALADVLAAVDASTSSATKAAYRSDWARFTTWATERGFGPLPAPPLVVAHYITEAAAEQTSVGKWRYTPSTLTRCVNGRGVWRSLVELSGVVRSDYLA